MQIYRTYQLLRSKSTRVIGFFLLCFCFCPLAVHAVPRTSKMSYVDSVYYSLSKKQRISKLLVLPINDFSQKEDVMFANEIIQDESVGGVIINNGEKEEVKRWISDLKSTKFPKRPFVALNLPELLDFPLDGGPELPGKEKIELVPDDSLVMDMGYLIGKEIQEVGFDVVILDPSPALTDWWVERYLDGLTAAGVTVVANQSNIATRESRLKIDEVEYIGLFADKLDTTAFEKAPYDTKARKALGYSGLVLGHPKYGSTVAAELCFNEMEQGADMVVLPDNREAVYQLMTTIYDIKPPKKKVLREKGKNAILFKKKLQHLNERKVDVRLVDLDELHRKALLNSVVLLKNERNVLPFKDLGQYHLASVSGNRPHDGIFRDYLKKYADIAHYDFDFLQSDYTRALKTLNHFDVVLANVSSIDLDEANGMLEYLKQVDDKSDVVIIYSGEKKGIHQLLDFKTIIWAPENNFEYAHLLPQNLFGARTIAGRLHRMKDEHEMEVMGTTIPAIGRLKYGDLATLGINTSELFKIDILVKDAIELGAFPGCQVFMAKNGTVVYNKSFGYQTYDSMVHVDDETIYDIASVTKVVATVPSLMFLNDWHKISLEDTLGHHVPAFHQSNKSGLKVRDLLTHQSGMLSYLPFWRNAEFDPEGDDFRFKLPRRRKYKYQPDQLSVNWADSIRSWIAASRLTTLVNDDGSFGYLYSDLGFMALKDLSEYRLNQSIDGFLEQNLFAPMGMASTGYTPLCRFPIDRISPTEKDDHLRNSLVWGNVHDRNAALLGGVSGHAGLFSNASDLGKYMQMQLQEGYYGGIRYFSPETVRNFTKKQDGSERRALGWDKPDTTVENASKYASDEAFGHSGFTGTIVWADPKHDLVYVFLSNRVYPDATNYKLIQNNIRTRIHDIMYESFLGAN